MKVFSATITKAFEKSIGKLLTDAPCITRFIIRQNLL
jgi:hypothetical protein